MGFFFLASVLFFVLRASPLLKIDLLFFFSLFTLWSLFPPFPTPFHPLLLSLNFSHHLLPHLFSPSLPLMYRGKSGEVTKPCSPQSFRNSACLIELVFFCISLFLCLPAVILLSSMNMVDFFFYSRSAGMRPCGEKSDGVCDRSWQAGEE